MMHDCFWWGANVGDLLFSGLAVENATAMVLTCLVFVLLTVLFEGFKVLQSKVRRNHNTRMRRAMQGICAEDRTNLLRRFDLRQLTAKILDYTLSVFKCMEFFRVVAGSSGNDQNTSSVSKVLKIKCIVIASQVLLHTTSTGFNYLIMLVVMMYNGYLVIAIILGITLGHFLFGHISMKHKMDQVREKAEVVTVCVPECAKPGCQLKEPDDNISNSAVDIEHQNATDVPKTQQIYGFTSPLLQGSDASDTNLNNSEVRSQAQNLSDQDAEVCKQTREADCCDSSTAKKTIDLSKIKSSKDATLGNKCCDKDTSRNDETAGGSNERDAVEVVSEKKKTCCSKDKNSEEKKEGVCAKAAKSKKNAEL